MVQSYTVIHKCFFMGAVRNVGDRMFLDNSVGDPFPHVVPSPEENQMSKQKTASKTKASAR